MYDEEYEDIILKLRKLFKKAMEIYNIEDYKTKDDWISDIVGNIEKLVFENLDEKRKNGHNENDIKEMEDILKKEIAEYSEKLRR